MDTIRIAQAIADLLPPKWDPNVFLLRQTSIPDPTTGVVTAIRSGDYNAFGNMYPSGTKGNSDGSGLVTVNMGNSGQPTISLFAGGWLPP